MGAIEGHGSLTIPSTIRHIFASASLNHNALRAPGVVSIQVRIKKTKTIKKTPLDQTKFTTVSQNIANDCNRCMLATVYGPEFALNMQENWLNWLNCVKYTGL